MENIYDSLTNIEINNFWKFIKVFTPKILDEEFLYSPTEYRDYLIKTIQKKYTIEEFYKNESDVNVIDLNN